jgi:diguanylate cyclase (GGDEF)-like protein
VSTKKPIRKISLPVSATRLVKSDEQARLFGLSHSYLLPEFGPGLHRFSDIRRAFTSLACHLTEAHEATLDVYRPLSDGGLFEAVVDEVPEATDFVPNRLESEACNENCIIVVPHLEERTLWRFKSYNAVAVLPLRIPMETGQLVVILKAWSVWPEFWTDERLNMLAALAELGPQLVIQSRKLSGVAFTDILIPQVFNRKYWEIQAPLEISRVLRENENPALREKKTLALCVADIDDFKSYNTRFGLKGGDQAIQHVGLILRASLRRSHEWVARWGGDEFAFILYDVNADKARAFLKSIYQRMEQIPLPVQDMQLEKVSISIGAALCPADGADYATLWRAAEEALRHGKGRGKGRGTLFGDI